MREPPLILSRRLAIRLLHEAQIAQPQPIRGVVTRRGAEPDGWRRADEPLTDGEHPWAALWSRPQAAAVPEIGELVEGQLSLVVSLNTKGVLEMRAWRLVDGVVREQELKIRD